MLSRLLLLLLLLVGVISSADADTNEQIEACAGTIRQNPDCLLDIEADAKPSRWVANELKRRKQFESLLVFGRKFGSDRAVLESFLFRLNTIAATGTIDDAMRLLTDAPEVDDLFRVASGEKDFAEDMKGAAVIYTTAFATDPVLGLKELPERVNDPALARLIQSQLILRLLAVDLDLALAEYEKFIAVERDGAELSEWARMAGLLPEYELARYFGIVLAKEGRWDDAFRLLEPEYSTEQAAQLAGGLTLLLLVEKDVDRAVDLSRRYGGNQRFSRGFSNAMFTAKRSKKPDEDWLSIEELIELADRIDEPGLTLSLRSQAVTALVEVGRPEEAEFQFAIYSDGIGDQSAMDLKHKIARAWAKLDSPEDVRRLLGEHSAKIVDEIFSRRAKEYAEAGDYQGFMAALNEIENDGPKADSVRTGLRVFYIDKEG